MKRRLAIALLAGLCLVIVAAGYPILRLTLHEGSSSRIEIPEVQDGDRAVYEGSNRIELTVGGLHNVLDGAANHEVGRVVSFQINDAAPGTEYLDARGWVIMTEECGVYADESKHRCTPWVAQTWPAKGAPGILGASILAGSWEEGASRTLRGDGREFAVGVVKSQSQIVFSVTSTAPWSLEVPSHVESESLVFNEGESLPVVVRTENQTWTRVSHVAGAATEVRPTEVGPLQLRGHAVPAEHGRPAEGVALDGYPSWSEARAGAGMQDIAGETCPDVLYSVGSTNTTVPGVGLSATTTTFRIDEWCWEQHGSVVKRSYTASRDNSIVGNVTGTHWSRSEANAAADDSVVEATANLNDLRSIPLWDLVRLGESIDQEFSSFAGFVYLHGSRPFLQLTGPGVSASDTILVTHEQLLLDGRTGLLVSALTYARDLGSRCSPIGADTHGAMLADGYGTACPDLSSPPRSSPS